MRHQQRLRGPDRHRLGRKRGDETVYGGDPARVGATTPPGFVKIARYEVAAKRWTFARYPLDAPRVARRRRRRPLGDHAARRDGHTVAIVERDDRLAGEARVKRLYGVDLGPGRHVARARPAARHRAQALLRDVLGDLDERSITVPDKLEGVGVTSRRAAVPGHRQRRRGGQLRRDVVLPPSLIRLPAPLQGATARASTGWLGGPRRPRLRLSSHDPEKPSPRTFRPRRRGPSRLQAGRRLARPPRRRLLAQPPSLERLVPSLPPRDRNRDRFRTGRFAHQRLTGVRRSRSPSHCSEAVAR